MADVIGDLGWEYLLILAIAMIFTLAFPLMLLIIRRKSVQTTKAIVQETKTSIEENLTVVKENLAVAKERLQVDRENLSVQKETNELLRELLARLNQKIG